MAAKFYPVKKEEMAALLEPWGFDLIALAGVVELVWQKIRPSGVAVRVFSGINPSGVSRGVGEDAIRVELYYIREGVTYRIGGTKRVHRVENWRENLKGRIATWKDWSGIGPSCPKCGAPTIEREVKKEGPNKGKKFYSCCTWAKTKCDGTVWPSSDAA